MKQSVPFLTFLVLVLMAPDASAAMRIGDGGGPAGCARLAEYRPAEDGPARIAEAPPAPLAIEAAPSVAPRIGGFFAQVKTRIEAIGAVIKAIRTFTASRFGSGFRDPAPKQARKLTLF